jgi:DNA-binding GntR family transcriptional regulator
MENELMVIKVNALNQQVYAILKNKILKKEILPGTRLIDSQLAKEFGISRTPLRDAIRKLVENGLVVPGKNGKGYYVYKPSAKDINEIFEMRLILDIAAATKLINTIIPEQPDILDKIAQFDEDDPKSDDSFVLNDEDFHNALIKFCNNSRMTEIYADLQAQTRAFRSVTSQDQTRIDKAKKYHKKIIDGFCSRQLGETIDAIKKHVEFSRLDALSDYSDQEDI